MWRVDGFQMLLAIALDLLLGDPRGWPHIARLAGRLSVIYEKLLTARLRRSVLLGVIFWLLVTVTIVGMYAVAWGICARVNPVAAWIFQALIIYQAIAAMDLARHVRAVIAPSGSIRDAEVIAAADERDIALVFSTYRYFLH